MRTQTSFFRVSAVLAATALGVAPCWPVPAAAQSAPVPAPAAPAQETGAPPGQPEGPPTRVGRLARITGEVSFHGAGETTWQPATLNYPLSTGMALWTQPQATAEVEIAGSQFDMMSQTEFDLTQLDDQALVVTEPQGEVCMHIRGLAQGETDTIETPRGTVAIGGPGHYAVIAGDTTTPTEIIAADGSVTVTGPGLTLQVGAGQMASITGTDSFSGQVQSAASDQCLSAMLAREQQAQATPSAVPETIYEMTGADDLSQYGSWQSAPEFGEVWYPQVGSDWVPYRDGRWAYDGAYGWTWVGSEPWGFAPFHYGRWVHVGGRWGWAPVQPGVPYYRPVYAPALVSFFSVGAGVAVGAAIGFAAGALAAGAVGWVPLGWNEPYYPSYRVGPRYFERLNAPYLSRPVLNRSVNIYRTTYIQNQRITNNRVVINQRNFTPLQHLANARAATIAPTTAMVRSDPLGHLARPAPEQVLLKAQPVVARPPVHPAAETVGLTPAAARSLGIRTPVAPEHRAPGPAVVTTERGARPGLRPANAVAPVHAPAPAVPHPTAPTAPAAAPGHLPPLHATGQPGPTEAARHAAPPTPAPQGPRPGGAPGPAIAPHANGAAAPALPALREHGAPGPLAPATHPPGVTPERAPGHAPGAEAHPGVTAPHAPAVAPPHAPEVHAPQAPAAPHVTAAPHPTPAARPVEHAPAAPHPAPHPEAHPAPHPAPAPRPESHPAPRPEPHAAPAPRPEPRPAPRPEPRPAPHVEARPAPHPAPPPHPAPAPHPQEGHGPQRPQQP
ncbi:MAG TPA: DUF6600 domain-containing protein [Acetobacteraceae bacterium]|nr:DUF6600 domain-containing protein [Acetobacteraceae bacterium]